MLRDKVGLVVDGIFFALSQFNNIGDNPLRNTHQNIAPLLDFVKIDRFYVVCHFKCDITKKNVISSVPFEPYEGAIEITFKEALFHPIASYNKYYHTPIVIYDNNCQESVVVKAFKRVSNKFRWDHEEEKFVHL